MTEATTPEPHNAWKSYLETCPEYVFVVGSDLRCNATSASFLRTTGLVESDVQGRPLSHLGFDSGTVRQLQENIRDVFQNGSPVFWEGRLFFGDRKRFDFVLTPIPDGAGRIASVVCSARRTTDLRRARHQLKLYRAVLNHMAEGVVVVRARDGIILYTNPTLDEMFGYQPGELSGCHVSILNAPGPTSPEILAEQLQSALRRDGSWKGEIRNRKKDGTGFECQVNISRFDHDEFGPVWVGVHQDITEHVRGRQALRDSEQHLRRILETMPVMLSAYDESGNIVFWNRECERVTGYSAQEARNHPEILKSLNRIGNGKEDVAGEQPGNGQREQEREVIARDGSRRTIAWSSNSGKLPIPGWSFWGIGVDVTRRKRDESDRSRFDEQVQRAQKLESLGNLAAGIAHDFNNLFAAIYANAELALRASTEPKETLYIQNILNSMSRAKSLSGQLLTFAPGEVLQRSAGELFPFIREVVEFALSGTNVSCRFLVEDHLWPCSFDRDRISQVIRNVVINAQQSMPGGGVVEIVARNVPSASMEPDSFLPDRVMIAVRDHGCGIPPSDRSRVFDPFFTTHTNASGLGLTISHSIIRQHGGSIDVESGEGNGTTIRIFLPAFLHAETSVPGPSIQGDLGRILVMDDEELILSAVQDLLESSGYSTVCALHGQEALEILEHETRAGRPFDAVIVDLTVRGGMGGKETLAAIRAMNIDVPVFVSSGYAGDPILSHPEDFGFAGCITKPFSAKELLQMLERQLTRTPRIPDRLP